MSKTCRWLFRKHGRRKEMDRIALGLSLWNSGVVSLWFCCVTSLWFVFCEFLFRRWIKLNACFKTRSVHWYFQLLTSPFDTDCIQSELASSIHFVCCSDHPRILWIQLRTLHSFKLIFVNLVPFLHVDKASFVCTAGPNNQTGFSQDPALLRDVLYAFAFFSHLHYVFCQ